MLEIEDPEEKEDEGKEIGGIFHLVSEKQRQKRQEQDVLDEDDNSFFPVTRIRDWTDEKVI